MSRQRIFMSQNWIGKQIGGRYQIDTLLGQGGMSAVYRATDPNLRRQVAVKLIHSHLSVDPNFVDRFKEEAAAVARLRHPNIVQVHDFNNDEETYYMVMEYLIGETLQARLRRLNAANRYMPYREVVTFCAHICDAVGYAHKRELVHRDIKPANIMLDLNGQAILMDFGIVKIIGGEYHTATGATVGTAAYMSPEQIRSERADERSDIYSLGVTLYEMLSGRPPFRADSALTLMMMVLNDPLPDLFAVRQGVPPAMVAAVEKALAKEPKDRFQTMEEMAAALRHALEQVDRIVPAPTVADEEQGERPPVAAAPRRQRVQERPRLSAMPTAVDPPARSIAAPRESARIEPEEPSVEPESAPKPPRTSDAGKPTLARRRFLLIAFLLLPTLTIALGDLLLKSQQPPAYQTTSIPGANAPIDAQNALAVVSLGMWQTGAGIEDLAYAPDGKLLGTAHNRERTPLIRYRFYSGLWDLPSGRSEFFLRGHSRWVNGIAFAPDSMLFAAASEDSTVTLWHVLLGSQALRIESASSGFTSVDFSPNGLLLATGSWDGTVGLWQVRDGHLLRSLTGHGDGVTDVAFSPDGDQVASASDDFTIRVWQVSDGRSVQAFSGHTAPVRRIAFSPDGHLLASASNDKNVGVWQLEDGGLLHALQGHSEPVRDVVFSRDGSLLFSAGADGTLRLWRVSDGQTLRLLAEDLDTINSLAISPDGRTLVSGEANGLIRFWGLSDAIPLESFASGY